MSILINRPKKYSLLSKKKLLKLTCKVRDDYQQRIRIADFDKRRCSKLKTRGIKYCFKVSNGRKDLVVLEAHNFPEVSHLDLAESTFVHVGKPKDFIRSELPYGYARVIRAEFDETCHFKMAMELLRRMDEITHPISRLIENFLKFARLSRCIRENEMLPVSRRILMRIYSQQKEMFGSDENLTVEILKAFSASDELKRSMVTGVFQCEHLDYVFRCCSAVKFDIENYLMNGYFSICPITKCITSPNHDIQILRILLQYGFEIQGDILREYGFFNDWKDQLYPGPLMELSYRRQTILLFFLQIIDARRNYPQWEWSDTFKLVFNSIPDPYMCETDLRPLKSNSLKQLIVLTLFKDLASYYSPRKLKHLSRCVIRKVLKVNFELPNGIDALPLPPALQSYLKHLGD